MSRVEHMMTSDLATIRVAATAAEAPQTMHRLGLVEHRIGAVPIVDSANVPVGIRSYVDVLRRVADDSARDARAIELMDR
jgi:CBS domain-containing protein